MSTLSSTILFRTAETADIPAMQAVRHAVKENVLSNPALVTDADCDEYINHRGRGWVCTIGDELAGFAIADLTDHNIWALFVDPVHEGKGIGKQLHGLMMDWYFAQTTAMVWLGTAPNTRAEEFYRRQGWTSKGLRPNGEVRFEMQYADWCGRG